MGHQMPDRLLPNESLQSGDALISSDGRYRLQFVPWPGVPGLYAYTTDGILLMKMLGVGSIAEPFVSLELPDIGGLILRNAQGTAVNLGVDIQGLHNRFLVVQSDGNLVQYAVENGHVQIATGTNGWYNFSAVEPNKPVVEIVPNAGTLVLGAGASDTDLFNGSGAPIGARDGNNYVVIDNGAIAPLKSAGAPGTVLISTTQYNFSNLQTSGPGTQPQRQQLVGPTSADAVPAGSTARPRITIGHAGLSLTGHRTNLSFFARKKSSDEDVSSK